MRERVWKVLANDCNVRLALPKPTGETSTGILSFVVPKASTLDHQKLQQALEDEGVILDTLGNRPGLRCCLHPELQDEDIEYAVRVLAKTLRP
jgi:selenocysteine lyase/cysteine desulfurase